MPRSNLILSLAELEWAWQYAEFLSLGTPEPESEGFDFDRIAEIRQTIQAEFYSRRNATFGRIRDRMRGDG